MNITSEMINKHWANVRLSKRETEDLILLIDSFLYSNQPVELKRRYLILQEKLKLGLKTDPNDQ